MLDTGPMGAFRNAGAEIAGILTSGVDALVIIAYWSGRKGGELNGVA